MSLSPPLLRPPAFLQVLCPEDIHDAASGSTGTRRGFWEPNLTGQLLQAGAAAGTECPPLASVTLLERFHGLFSPEEHSPCETHLRPEGCSVSRVVLHVTHVHPSPAEEPQGSDGPRVWGHRLRPSPERGSSSSTDKPKPEGTLFCAGAAGDELASEAPEPTSDTSDVKHTEKSPADSPPPRPGG